MNKKYIAILGFSTLIVYSNLVSANDLSNIINPTSYMNGEVLNPISSGKHTFLGAPVSSIRPMTSILTLEKSKEDWQKEILPQMEKWNQFVCSSRQNCQKVSNPRNINFYNSFRLNSSLELKIDDNVNSITSKLDKMGIKIKQVPAPKSAVNSNIKVPDLHFANIVEPRDKEKRISNPALFKSTVEFIDYLQLNSGSAIIQLILKEQANKTIINYTCMVGFSMTADGKEMAQKYNLMFYRPTQVTKQVEKIN